MPIFILGPIWLVVTVAGLALLLFARFRYLSPYLVLGSTLGFIFSLIVSTGLLLIAALLGRALEIKGGSFTGIALILMYLASIVIGGLLGIVGGWFLARKVNKFLGWQRTQASRC